jgi:hypothetical protein
MQRFDFALRAPGGTNQCQSTYSSTKTRPAERLVIERDESTLESDRRTVNAATHRFGCHGTLRYDLLAPKADPLLWVPDAVVWSWIRGGDWRRSVAPFCQLREL